MKASHRDKLLDSLLNQRVRITFVDKACFDGVLKWQGYLGELRANTYYLALNEPGLPKKLSFRKTHIRRIEKL